jgi:UDP-N-acetylglucosamine--N-acetylmuramyl-(pentapeptide) pyrophosphoryl-undecaprenol N-acetylglucosamine transferase
MSGVKKGPLSTLRSGVGEERALGATVVVLRNEAAVEHRSHPRGEAAQPEVAVLVAVSAKCRVGDPDAKGVLSGHREVPGPQVHEDVSRLALVRFDACCVLQAIEHVRDRFAVSVRRCRDRHVPHDEQAGRVVPAGVAAGQSGARDDVVVEEEDYACARGFDAALASDAGPDASRSEHDAGAHVRPIRAGWSTRSVVDDDHLTDCRVSGELRDCGAQALGRPARWDHDAHARDRSPGECLATPFEFSCRHRGYVCPCRVSPSRRRCADISREFQHAGCQHQGKHMTVLFVAATGGHLAQLDRLAPRILTDGDDAVWVTFDTPQSRSLLGGRRRVFIPYTGPRDLRNVIRNTRVAGQVMRSLTPSLVVSTGNAVAVSFLPVARALGLPAAYIESAARAESPSMTGRILQCVPGIQLFTQYRGWARGRWTFAGSVFEDFAPAGMREPKPIERVVVTLGTIHFGFRRLVERLIAILPPECEVLWQVGQTDARGLGIDAHSLVPADELSAAMRRADVVVAHAGIGSALTSLEAGRCPVLVPRLRRYGEHVDDHQRQIANELDGLGLAVARDVADLRLADLLDASKHAVCPNPAPGPIRVRGARALVRPA